MDNPTKTKTKSRKCWRFFSRFSTANRFLIRYDCGFDLIIIKFTPKFHQSSFRLSFDTDSSKRTRQKKRIKKVVIYTQFIYG